VDIVYSPDTAASCHQGLRVIDGWSPGPARQLPPHGMGHNRWFGWTASATCTRKNARADPQWAVAKGSGVVHAGLNLDEDASATGKRRGGITDRCRAVQPQGCLSPLDNKLASSAVIRRQQKAHRILTQSAFFPENTPDCVASRPLDMVTEHADQRVNPLLSAGIGRTKVSRTLTRNPTDCRHARQQHLDQEAPTAP
jgi:hypothetical protein